MGRIQDGKQRCASRWLTNDFIQLTPPSHVGSAIVHFGGTNDDERKLEVELAENWIEELVQKKKSEIEPGIDFDFSREILSKRFKLSGATIDRLFRAMLVYSFGIYDMLKATFKHRANNFELVTDYWDMYLKLVEGAHPVQHEEAIRAIGEQEVHSRDGQEQLLAERQNKLNRQEAHLDAEAKQLEEQAYRLAENDVLTKQMMEEEQKAETLLSLNAKLAEKKVELEGEQIEWMKTIQFHEEQHQELSKDSRYNLGQIEVLIRQKLDLEQQIEQAAALTLSLQRAIGDVNLRIVTVESSLDIDRRKSAELNIQVESAAQSKQVLGQIVESQENMLSELVGREKKDSQSANDVDVLLDGQQSHNSALRQSIQSQQATFLETETALTSKRAERNEKLKTVLELESVLVHSWQIFTRLLKKSQNFETSVHHSQIKTYSFTFRLQKMIDEIDDSVEEVSNTNTAIRRLRSELVHTAMERRQRQSELDLLTTEQTQLGQLIDVTLQDLWQVTITLNRTRSEHEMQSEQFAIFMSNSEALQQLFEQNLLDSGAKISDEAEDMIKFAAEAEQLSLARADWEKVIDIKMASMKTIQDEIGEIQSISKAVVVRDEEQERLGKDILKECRNTKKNLIPTLAKLESLKSELYETQAAYDKNIIELEMAISDARDEKEQKFALIEDEKTCFVNEQHNWALAFDSANHELKLKELRVVENCKHINECISASDTYLRYCYDAIQELRLCQNWRESELKELRTQHINESSERGAALLELHRWSEIDRESCEAEHNLISQLEQIAATIAANDEHRAAIEIERTFCEKQLIRRTKLAKEKQLQLQLLENNEWRRFGRLATKATQMALEMADVSTMTDAGRMPGTRETLATAPILVGLERTFNAVNVIIQQAPITRVPRSIRLNILQSDNFALEDLKSLSTGPAKDERTQRSPISSPTLPFDNRLTALTGSLRHAPHQQIRSSRRSDAGGQLAHWNNGAAWTEISSRRQSFAAFGVDVEMGREEGDGSRHVRRASMLQTDAVPESPIGGSRNIKRAASPFHRHSPILQNDHIQLLEPLNQLFASVQMRSKSNSPASSRCRTPCISTPASGSGWSPRPPLEPSDRFMPTYVRRQLQQVRATSISDLLDQ